MRLKMEKEQNASRRVRKLNSPTRDERVLQRLISPTREGKPGRCVQPINFGTSAHVATV